MLKNRVIWYKKNHSSESARPLTSIVTEKMRSVMALDDVTSFWRLKDVHVCETVKLLAGFLQCNGGKLEVAEDFK